MVRDQCPDGECRAARVFRTLGSQAEAIGLEVPMRDAGQHTVSVQVTLSPQQFYTTRELNEKRSVNEVFYTNCLIVLVKNMRCSQLHCQKG